MTKNKQNKGFRFVVVGVGNTILDFALMNVFSLFLPWILPNLFSTGIAMVSSFYFNKKWTFNSQNKSRQELRREIVLFFVFTIIGIWIIQTPLMYWIKNFSFIHDAFANVLPQFSNDFLAANFAKVIASVASLTWNFLTYKNFVFKNSKAGDEALEISGA